MSSSFFGVNRFMFSSTVASKARVYGEKVKFIYPVGFGDISKGPQKITIKRRKIPLSIDTQPIPLHDYMNFKKMSGNEILLNLDNVENLRDSELVSGLLELARRDKNHEHDWNNHKITVRCIEALKKRLPCLTSKNVIQSALIFDRLKILD